MRKKSPEEYNLNNSNQRSQSPKQLDMSNSKMKNFNLTNVTDYREITKILSKIAE